MANITTVKKTLKGAFPDVAFTYGQAGRGRLAGHCVTWEGATGVRLWDVQSALLAAGCGYGIIKHFSRRPTPIEDMVTDRMYEFARARRKAEEPARRAQAKADGVAKRRATVAARKAVVEKLSTTFPSIAFTIKPNHYGSYAVAWLDGPESETVAALLNIHAGHCTRIESPEGKRNRIATARIARRLARSRQRAELRSKAIARKARARLHADRCTYFNAAQFTFLAALEPAAADSTAITE